MSTFFYSSITRSADLTGENVEMRSQPREQWRNADYVIGEVISTPGSLSNIELTTGRMVTVMTGDRVVGALGKRCATLETVGDWQKIGRDGEMEALTAAGVFGICTSKCAFLPPLLRLRYCGHLLVDDVPQRLERKHAHATITTDIPVVLIIGTSMDSGKTLTAKTVIRLLKANGLRVGGAKLTGMGRYRDILAMRDAGADCIVDFVDAGLASTCCPREEFEGVVNYLMSRFDKSKVDVVVAEAGASPLEPYNGDEAVMQLASRIRFTILCASDPYAVVGVQQAFPITPDVIAGRATCTMAAIDLLAKLSDIPSVNLLDEEYLAGFSSLLLDALQ